MKIRMVLLLVVTIVSACSRDPKVDAVKAQAAAATAARASSAADESVAAVAQGASALPLQMRFVLEAKPVAGMPAKLRLQIVPTGALPNVHMTVTAEHLTLDPASAQADLDLSEVGKAVDHAVEFTPQIAGLQELIVSLKPSSGESQITNYAIPMLVDAEGPPPAPK
jgi:hypothetical protein